MKERGKVLILRLKFSQDAFSHDSELGKPLALHYLANKLYKNNKKVTPGFPTTRTTTTTTTPPEVLPDTLEMQTFDAGKLLKSKTKKGTFSSSEKVISSQGIRQK